MINYTLPKKYLQFFDEAKSYEKRCFTGKRWGGNPLLILVDSALDSSGLSYFNIVVPRVKKFELELIKTGIIKNIEDFSRFSPDNPSLLSIFNNKRVWYVAIELSKIFKNMKSKNPEFDYFKILKKWAIKADCNHWKEDLIGKIKGVGLVTFQYLRMQLGVDACMPDRIIKKFSKIIFDLKWNNDLDFIKKYENLCKNIGVSQILLSWLIWLAESDKK